METIEQSEDIKSCFQSLIDDFEFSYVYTSHIHVGGYDESMLYDNELLYDLTKALTICIRKLQMFNTGEIRLTVYIGNVLGGLSALKLI